MNEPNANHNEGWLDKLAISMAVLCAIHCLIVPVMIVTVPLISTTFFVHENFHLWMLIAVFPTTLASILLGCKKHRDKYVLAFCFIGLALSWGLFYGTTGIAHCASCAGIDAGSGLSNIAWINTLGGVISYFSPFKKFLSLQKAFLL